MRKWPGSSRPWRTHPAPAPGPPAHGQRPDPRRAGSGARDDPAGRHRPPRGPRIRRGRDDGRGTAGRSSITSTRCRCTRSTSAGSPSSSCRISTPSATSSATSNRRPSWRSRSSSTSPTSPRPRSGSGMHSPTGDQTAAYWGHRNVSDWTKGASWQHERLDGSGVDGGGTILEIDPPRRLSHTWGDLADAEHPDRLSRDVRHRAGGRRRQAHRHA